MATIEERRARDAERKRAARAKARAERDNARADAAAASAKSAPRTMRNAVSKSIAAASKWITDSDGAAVAQAQMLATQIDELTHAGETVKALSAHRTLTTVLAQLGATPTVRMQHELRSRRLVPDPEGGDGGNEQPTGANVSKFERPAKRAR